MKVFLQTYGCQMNKLDSALVSAALKDAGFEIADNEKDTDAVLINTCSVREHAEQRVLSHLGHLKHIKKNRPEVVVGVIGCMAQRLGGKLLEHEAVDIVCGPAQIPKITEFVTQALQEKKKCLAVTEKIREISEIQAQALEEFESVYGIEDKQVPGQAYVRAMRGCNNFCSYCIVPYVRGPEISRPPEVIIEQIKKLANAGIKQVTLLGQRVNAYKYKSGDKTYCLADLLERASSIEGIEWLRFVTSYPTEKFLDEILRVMAELPKVCNYLHLPAQSGSDKILRAMNRHYTAGQYLELLDRARSIVPDIVIAGDFIVGFPGETEEDFQATVDLVTKARYKNCFIFKYSPRPDTIADKRLKDNVPLEIKKRRNTELLAVQENISDELSKDFLGKEVKVLVEGLSKKPQTYQGHPGRGTTGCPSTSLRAVSKRSESNRKPVIRFDGNPQLVGRTTTDYIVVFNGPSSLAGEFAKVKITKTSPLTLFGELI